MTEAQRVRVRTVTIILAVVLTVAGVLAARDVSHTTDESSQRAPTSVGPTTTQLPFLDDVAAAPAPTPFANCGEIESYLRSEAAARVNSYNVPFPSAPQSAYFGAMGWSPTSDDTDVMAPAREVWARNAPDSHGVADGDGASRGGPVLLHRGVLFQLGPADFPTSVRVIELGVPSTQLASLKLDGTGKEMLIAGDRLVVVGDRDTGIGVTIYDVRRPATPVLVSSTTLTQLILQRARLVGDRVVIAARTRFELPRDPTPYQVIEPFNQARENARNLARRRGEARRISVDAWMPKISTAEGGGPPSAPQPLMPCERVYRPAAFSGFFAADVISFPTRGDARPDATALFTTDNAAIHLSARRAYVATNAFSQRGVGTSDGQLATPTLVHAFGVGERVSYRATGLVPGYVVSAHPNYALTTSMTAYRGRLVVGHGDGVSLFEERGARLGIVKELPLGARSAVGFTGSLAYAVPVAAGLPVTLLDVGELGSARLGATLPIPSISTVNSRVEDLLVPIGDGRVVSVHRAPATDREATDVVVTDVRDIDHPVEVSRTQIPGYPANNVAPSTYAYFPSLRLLVVAMTLTTGYGATFFNGNTYHPGGPQVSAFAVGLRITRRSVRELGRVNEYTFNSPLSRVVMADGRLYLVTPGGDVAIDPSRFTKADTRTTTVSAP